MIQNLYRLKGAIIGLEGWGYFRKIILFPSGDKGFVFDECIWEQLGVRERDRKLLPEIQSKINKDQGTGWDEDRVPKTWWFGNSLKVMSGNN